MEESPDGLIVLYDGLTLHRVAPGLLLTTLARPDGVSSELWDMWDLQQLMDELAARLAN